MSSLSSPRRHADLRPGERLRVARRLRRVDRRRFAGERRRSGAARVPRDPAADVRDRARRDRSRHSLVGRGTLLRPSTLGRPARARDAEADGGRAILHRPGMRTPVRSVERLGHNRYLARPVAQAWAYIKEQGFLGMIIPKRYGGRAFSAYAHSQVIMKLATHSSAAVSVMVPNSLGPAELLLHYGTEAQKDYYLPRLARGDEIPCFALTSPYAGSDAAAIPDVGIVCRGVHEGRKTLAFRALDPDHLLGDADAPGITCALIPAKHPGVHIGRRHWPLNAVDGMPRGGAHDFAAVVERRHVEARGARHRRLCRRPPPVPHLNRQVRGIQEALGRMGGNLYCDGCRAPPVRAGRRSRREAVGHFHDRQVSPDRARPQGRQRRHGRGCGQWHLHGTVELSGARISRCRSRSRSKARTFSRAA